MKGKTRKILSIVLIISFVLTLVFIWGNSMDSRVVSSEKSSFFTTLAANMFAPIINRFDISNDQLAHFIRKLAHFSEYFVLGLEVAFILLILQKNNNHNIAHGFSLGLAAAVIDESIQIVSGRGAMVVDVLLDFTGFSAAFAIVILVFCIVKHVKNNKKAER